MKKFFVQFCMLSCLFSFTSLNAQTPLEIKPIQGNVVFDGRPDEAVWQSLSPLQFSMLQPNPGGSPTELTDVRVGFTENYLYVGACLYYQDLSIMQAVGKKRDYDQMSTDWFGIHLDTYNDKQNAMIFYTNPNGIRMDASVKRDLKSFEQDVNFSWNTYWEVKTQIDDQGWYAEMKIPLSSLRFQENLEGVIMGMAVERFIPGKNELLTFPAFSPEYNIGNWKPSLAHEVVFKGLKSKKPRYISPYLLAGIGQESILNDAETAYERETSPKLDAGLDVKLGLTNNLTMDLTLNTDFAQVEADDQQINLKRTSLFFPEKRVFFQEKTDALDFPMGGPNNLFYSRRVGMHDGKPVRILGGVRVSGRAGKWDIGLLDMQTAKIEELPSENFGVMRFKRTVFNSNSYVGGMMTSRVGMDGSYNLAFGLDANIRMFGDDYLNFHMARVLENGLDHKPGFLDPMRVQLVWERLRDEGFVYDITMTYSGLDFNPGMAFLWRENYYSLYSKLQYGWVPGQSSKLLRHNVHTQLIHASSLIDHSIETLILKTGWKFEMRSGFSGDLVHNFEYQYLIDTLEIGDQANILPGRYQFHYLSTEMMTPPSSPIVGALTTELGTFYDGWKVSANLMPTWNASSSFDLSGTYRLDWVNFNERSVRFLNHIIGIKALWTFTTKLSMAGFVQYNTAVDDVISNIRFRYNPREGVDFYLVYNEGLNTVLDAPGHLPRLPLSEVRALMAKFTYTFGL